MKDETALQLVTNRGDSFDLGSKELVRREPEPDLIRILENPKELQNFLDLTPKQAANLRSLIIGSGTGGIHYLLSKHLGDEVSAVIGALASSWASKKLIGR